MSPCERAAGGSRVSRGRTGDGVSPNSDDNICVDSVQTTVFAAALRGAARPASDPVCTAHNDSSNTSNSLSLSLSLCVCVSVCVCSQLLARWPATHCRILYGIQRAAQTGLSVYLKRICSRVTSTSSALAVLNQCFFVTVRAGRAYRKI